MWSRCLWVRWSVSIRRLRCYLPSVWRGGVLLLLCVMLGACANRPETGEEQQARIDRLARALQVLSPTAPPARSRQVAVAAVQEAAALRAEYQVRLTPWLHNVEVNSGTRSRGHCYHYARDLRSRLQGVVSPYWQLYLLQARAGTVLEHNAIGIASSHADWQQSLVLDAWRDAGVLFFAPVGQDSYPWRLR